MATQPKNRRPGLAFKGTNTATAERMRRGVVETAGWLGYVRHWLPRWEEANLNRARGLLAAGQPRDAIWRLKLVLWRRPEWQLAWTMLGNAQLQDGRHGDAEHSLRTALRMKPGDEHARYLMAQLQIQTRRKLTDPPHTTPPEILEDRYAPIAAAYEHIELGRREYEGNMAIFNAWQAAGIPEGGSVLELGCGTGICGRMLGSLAASLQGVELVDAMRERAALLSGDMDLPVYDALHAGDLRGHLLGYGGLKYDVIVAVNVMNEVGGLRPVFDGAARSLTAGGWLALTVETIEEDGYRLSPETMRFVHGKPYLRQAVQNAGLEFHSLEPITLYPDTASHLLLCRKP